jgi:hypothetical protein
MLFLLVKSLALLRQLYSDFYDLQLSISLLPFPLVSAFERRFEISNPSLLQQSVYISPLT